MGKQTEAAKKNAAVKSVTIMGVEHKVSEGATRSGKPCVHLTPKKGATFVRGAHTYKPFSTGIMLATEAKAKKSKAKVPAEDTDDDA